MANAAEIPKQLALSPKRRREKRRDLRAGSGKMTHTWYMNEEHETITD
jgi:hypothetical protein